MAERIYGLLGRKLGHSWSAPIHRALGCGDYRLVELEPEELGAFLARGDIGGLNVTIPYKRDVMAFCGAIDPAAREIGSVNTIVRRADGTLYGSNTDIDGFLYMTGRAGIDMGGKKVVILGSGGASLTAQAAARQGRAREIVVVSRGGADNYENLDRHADADILVNTTPVGMWPDLEGESLDLGRLPNLSAVVDVIYNPGRTNLLLQAQARGIRHTGGLSMLVAQAKRAEELFFDQKIPDSRTEEITASLWRDMTNIVLVGMPGCGKTVVGRALADLSGKTFVDLDGEIVRMAGCSIPEIFRTQGEPVFRDLEHQALMQACAQSHQVIATGGGAVLRPENRLAMRRTGRVYQIQRKLEDLPTDGRPLSQAGDLAGMQRRRAPLYAAASDAAVWNETSPAEAAAGIWRDFCAYSGDQRTQSEHAGHPAAGDLRDGLL